MYIYISGRPFHVDFLAVRVNRKPETLNPETIGSRVLGRKQRAGLGSGHDEPI